jgi:hypothetical protein
MQKDEIMKSDIQKLPCVYCGKKTNRYNKNLHVVIHANCEDDYKFYQPTGEAPEI